MTTRVRVWRSGSTSRMLMTSTTMVLSKLLTYRWLTLIPLSISSVMTFKLIILDLCVVTCCRHNDHHKKNQGNHNVHTDIISDLNFIRCAPAINTIIWLTLRPRFTHIKVRFHALSANASAARAISEWTARLRATITICFAGFDTEFHSGAEVTRTASR